MSVTTSRTTALAALQNHSTFVLLQSALETSISASFTAAMVFNAKTGVLQKKTGII
jgi:hypothetical protein